MGARDKKVSPKMALSGKIKIPLPLSPLISNDDIITGFKKWKEKTTTSPSSHHLGIYKTLTQPNHEDENDLDIQ